MADLWRVLDLSAAECSLESKRGGIIIRRGGEEAVTVSVADLACVVLGPHVAMKSGILHHLTEAGTAVLFCDWKGVPEGAAFAWREHTRIGARRRAQAALTVPKQKNAWKQIVRGKIKNQAYTLDGLGKSGDFLISLANSVRSGDPSNVEGQAARYYWQRLFGSDFNREQHTCEGVNSMLDYAYTVARGHAVRGVLSAGLEPSLGVFHRHRENMFSLADDILEVVRPAIDYEVYRLKSEGYTAVSECRAELVAAASRKFSKDGYTIPTILSELARDLGRYFEGDISQIEIPAWFPSEV
ncbi:MAG: type II CRISPR-associated endonuclease Cas1 [Actinomycetaceae bacterium]|nr:type II CRISPR-associated endonuclease Cas1 [Actinomycetaceae bacterium]